MPSADFIPKELSKKRPTPVSLRLADQVRTNDGSHPSDLTELKLQLDRHLKLDLQGLPICRAGIIQDGPSFDSCRDAIVGHGRLATEIAFPEQPVIRKADELIAYNAGIKGGVPLLLLRTVVTVPTPAPVISSMKLEPVDNGRYGTEAVIRVPKIAGGSGSVTYLGIRFRKGIFAAVCRGGRLQFRSEATFADGTLLGGTVVRACRPAD